MRVPCDLVPDLAFPAPVVAAVRAVEILVHPEETDRLADEVLLPYPLSQEHTRRQNVGNLLVVLGVVAWSMVIPRALAESSAEPEGRLFANGVQAGVLELLWQEYSVKHEHLFGRRDAVALEGSLIDSPNGLGYTLGISYRRHHPGQLAGGFWGPFLSYKHYDDEYEEKVDGRTATHPYSVSGTVVGLNWGHRWIWRSGPSAVLRLGYGVPFVDVVWKDTRPAEHPGVIEGLLKFAQGLDGEVSVGYCF